jgi:hypothetical protein
MEKYFLGICIVIASLIYVWGNQWGATSTSGSKNHFATKYNRITGEVYMGIFNQNKNKVQFILIEEREKEKQND